MQSKKSKISQPGFQQIIRQEGGSIPPVIWYTAAWQNETESGTTYIILKTFIPDPIDWLINNIIGQEQYESACETSESPRFVDHTGSIWQVLTAAEVAQEYDITENAVRKACANLLDDSFARRKSGATWLIDAVDASKRWSRRITAE
jgi:hypothetical protein